MLLKTTDKLQLVTGQAANIDTYVEHVTNDAGTLTSDREVHNAITTATTTDICAAPSSGVRKPRYVNIRNKHASALCDVTVVQDISGTDTEIIKVTLAAGDILQYTDELGWYKIPNPVDAPAPNVSTADQVIGASTTAYIVNSDLHITAGRPLRVGTVIRWHITFSKSAAATASMTFDMRVGTAGTTADTSRGSLATGTQTAVADNGELEVACTIRSIAASGVMETAMQMEHNFAATGLGPTNVVTSATANTGADTTATNLVFGMSLTTGALHSITIRRAVAEILAGTI